MLLANVMPRLLCRNFDRLLPVLNLMSTLSTSLNKWKTHPHQVTRSILYTNYRLRLKRPWPGFWKTVSRKSFGKVS